MVRWTSLSVWPLTITEPMYGNDIEPSGDTTTDENNFSGCSTLMSRTSSTPTVYSPGAPAAGCSGDFLQGVLAAECLGADKAKCDKCV